MSWVEKHSVNCIYCGRLFDEREGIPGPEYEGTVCPKCIKEGRKTIQEEE
jgi:hypothetical protein